MADAQQISYLVPEQRIAVAREFQHGLQSIEQCFEVASEVRHPTFA